MDFKIIMGVKKRWKIWTGGNKKGVGKVFWEIRMDRRQENEKSKENQTD